MVITRKSSDSSSANGRNSSIGEADPHPGSNMIVVSLSSPFTSTTILCPSTSIAFPYAASILDCSAFLQKKFQTNNTAATPNKIRNIHFIILNTFFLMLSSLSFLYLSLLPLVKISIQPISENTIFFILSLLTEYPASLLSSINSEALSSISLILIFITSISFFNQKLFKHLSSTPQSGFYCLGIHLKLLCNLIHFFVLVIVSYKNFPVRRL
ncbi:hypothetical protein IMSAGC013_03858 [Lachnospiraceae bacterium]|nr:hypothetical protein IMSAGC013_03858 [Lachnospiraceae bacterium]